MCLITEQKEPIITKEETIGYKVLNRDLSSISQHFKYEYNKLYVTKIKHSSNPRYPSQKSMDYYINKYKGHVIQIKYNPDNNKIINNNVINNNVIALGQGYHYYTSYDEAIISFMCIERKIIVKCIIPANSEVYYDAIGNAVSNQIIIKKV